jgi:hypothetical protein
LLAVLALAAGMTVARVRVTLADPNFDAHDSSGLLKSDPGLLVYLTQRVIAAHGNAPADWHADPRIEHPATYDVPARLPVAQELVVAWLRIALGDALPLHVFCLWIAGAFASLVLVGTWLLALELAGDAWLALLAALLAALLPATLRTMGFVLMDEDFSLPFFALHLGLLARAARVRTPVPIALAAVALGCALATWHAASFLATIEALCALAVCVRRAENPLAVRGAWLFPAILIAFALAVPFLRTALFVCSVPMAVAVGLLVAARITAADAQAVRRRAHMVACVAVLVTAAIVLGRRGDEYGHVFGLIAAKIEHLGVLPDDPRALDPDVRLMWQGPFATLGTSAAATLLGLTLLVAPFAVHAAWTGLRRASSDPVLAATALLACGGLFGAWLVERVVVLPAMVLPALAAGIAVRRIGTPRARIAFCIGSAVQGAFFWSWITTYSNPWYSSPRQRQPEIAAMVHAVERFVPADGAIACDSINATAILAQTGRRVILSPKWESRSSRERVVEFLRAFYSDTPHELHELLVGKYDCGWLLVDRFTLGYLSRYAAGLPAGSPGPEPGTAAAVFLGQDESALAGVPGFELVYRSPPGIRQSNGAPADFFRLYRLAR